MEKITKIGKKGLDLIKAFEGLFLKPYLCPAGIPTIGYGNTFYENGKKIDELKNNGINDPINTITNNLYNNPKLIPYPAVLAGKMTFNKISLLGDKWVIAGFDDGHIRGQTIQKYFIKKAACFQAAFFMINHFYFEKAKTLNTV